MIGSTKFKAARRSPRRVAAVNYERYDMNFHPVDKFLSEPREVQ